jgi:uncharacterized membrane protein YphA (DoxX/SURF4 family)
MKILLGIIRTLVGILFIFSGLIKANDPLGLCYKMQEFFSVLHLNFLAPAALTLSVIMIGFEIIAGVALLLGCQMRFFGTLLLLLMILFLFLTAFAYLSGKIKECGCFGDCIPLTAGASFWKDVILFVLVLILFSARRRIKPLFGRWATALWMLVGIGLAFGIQWYTLRHLPVVDCLAYKIGNNIPALMKIPPGSIPDQYATVFVYEKNGQTREFAADSIPWQDTTWHFISREDKLVKKGNAEPVIKDFVITDFAGNDSTGKIVSEPGFVFLFMVKQTPDAATGWEQKLVRLQADCLQYGVKIYGITSSDSMRTGSFVDHAGIKFPFLQMDGTVIKTAARTNPCLLLLRKGTILGKWSYLDMPVGAIPSPDRGHINLKF